MRLLLIILMFALMAPADAQLYNFTKSQLEAYAKMEDSVADIKSSLTKKFNKAILEDSILDEGAQYLVIKEVYPDTSLLEERSITELELAAYRSYQQELVEMKDSIKNLKKQLIQKDPLNYQVYREIKNKLHSDPYLKADYRDILDSINGQVDPQIDSVKRKTYKRSVPYLR